VTQRITNDLNDYKSAGLTSDGTTLVTARSDKEFNIWIAPDGDGSRATAIRSNNFDGAEGLAWLPNGRVVYSSRSGSNSDLWTMNPDGSDERQLTAREGNNRWPCVPADGRYIVFMSDRGAAMHMEDGPDGRNQMQLTHGGSEFCRTVLPTVNRSFTSVQPRHSHPIQGIN
jgi:TolB protein